MGVPKIYSLNIHFLVLLKLEPLELQSISLIKPGGFDLIYYIKTDLTFLGTESSLTNKMTNNGC